MKIGYLGTGTWGTALSYVLSVNKHQVKAWDYNTDLVKSINTTKKHPKLANFTVPSDIQYVESIEEAIDDVDIIIESVTSGGIRPVFEKVRQILQGKKIPPIVITSKGIEQKTNLLFPEVVEEIIGSDNKNLIGCLSGPTHAEEVVKKLPTSLVAAAYDTKVMKSIVDIFNNPLFRVYPNSDILGVAFGGAMKNIIAIACAISDGLNFGDNTKAALLTRGLHEIRKLSITKGCNPETLNGLAGLGDLFVTCASTLSRNYRFGRLIAQGYSIDKAKEEIGMVVEGVYSCVSGLALAKANNVPVPITEVTYGILYNNLAPDEAVMALLQREIKEERL
jgi:glycerol-3-phosphate dehydrogenase (NAD(P)+)